MNIAFLSPNQSSYSETFIKAQKEGLKGHVLYYYGGYVPTILEDIGDIQIPFGTFRKKLGLLNNDVQSHSLSRSLKTNNIEVVLAQYGPTGESVAAICDDLNIPLVVHFHGYDAAVMDVIQKFNRYTNAFRVAKYIIAVSKDMIKDLIQLGCPEEKIVYNPCAPHPDFLSVTPKFNTKHFLSVGRFTDKKAPYLTILAFNKVVKKHPEAKLFMVGEGELLNTCKNLTTYLGINNSVTFMGKASKKEIMSLMENALAFVQHSIQADNGDKEGTPVAVLEASLAGLAVVATKHAGIEDIIIDKETGFLVNEHDTNAMADYMITLIKNKDLAKRIGSMGRMNIKENYSMKTHIYKLQSTLNSIFQDK